MHALLALSQLSKRSAGGRRRRGRQRLPALALRLPMARRQPVVGQRLADGRPFDILRILGESSF